MVCRAENGHFSAMIFVLSFDLYTEYLRLCYVPKWRFVLPLFLFWFLFIQFPSLVKFIRCFDFFGLFSFHFLCLTLNTFVFGFHIDCFKNNALQYMYGEFPATHVPINRFIDKQKQHRVYCEQMIVLVSILGNKMMEMNRNQEYYYSRQSPKRRKNGVHTWLLSEN